MDSEFAWMFHEETGNYAQLPIGAIAYWTPRGWAPSDPPLEIDPTRAHLADVPTVEPTLETPEPISAQATAPESKSPRSGKAGSTEGAE